MEYKKKPCPGPDCPGCSSSNCMSKGGEVEELPKPNGTTEKFSPKGKMTPIGKMTREDNLRKYKESEWPKLKGLAAGGEVQDTYSNEAGGEGDADHIKTEMDDPSSVPADSPLRIKTEMDADGGEVGRGDDDEMDDAMGEELINAVHKKDKKAIMESLKAIAYSIKNRGD